MRWELLLSSWYSTSLRKNSSDNFAAYYNQNFSSVFPDLRRKAPERHLQLPGYFPRFIAFGRACPRVRQRGEHDVGQHRRRFRNRHRRLRLHRKWHESRPQHESTQIQARKVGWWSQHTHQGKHVYFRAILNPFPNLPLDGPLCVAVGDNLAPIDPACLDSP